MKKLITLTLSLLMAFSLCLTISADNDDSGDSSTIEAKIGEQEYTSFVEAFSALKDGDTLKLEDNVTVILNDSGYDYPGCDTSLWSNVPNVTLDLNNYTLTTISNYGGSYNVLNVFADGWTIKNGSMIVKLKDGTADSYVLAVEQEEPINLTIDNVSLSGGVAAYSTVTVTMTNTKMGATEVAATEYYCGYAERGAKFIINGGTYTSDGTCPVFYTSGSDSSVEISGGNFNGSIFGGEGTISISGGSFSNDVTKYLASGYNAVKKADGTYQIVSEKEEIKVDVDQNKTATPALEESAYNIAKSAIDAINKDKDENDKITFDSSTKVELEIADADSNKYTKEEETKVITEAKKVITDIANKEIKTLPLDITLNVVNGEDKTPITDLSEEITVTLYLNDETLSAIKDNKPTVVRIHGEEYKALDTTLKGNALSFKTNKFSTYVIAYSNTSSSSGSSSSTTTTTPIKTYDAKDKNQDGIITCDEEMNSTNWVWSTAKGACVYKVSNTSAK